MGKWNKETKYMDKTIIDKTEIKWKFTFLPINTIHVELITPEASVCDIAYFMIIYVSISYILYLIAFILY